MTTAFSSALMRRMSHPPWWVASLRAWWNGTSPDAGVRRAIRALDLSADHRVCDLGFGCGSALPGLLASVPYGQVVGVDASADRVRHAGRTYEPWVRAGQLQLLEGSATQIPVADASLDAVLAVHPTAPESPGWAARSGEIARVLGPTGRLVAVLGSGHGADPEACAEALRDVGFAVAIDDDADGSALLVASPV